MIFRKAVIIKYKIKDIKRILNIKEETLRYYDNQDIIKTSRDGMIGIYATEEVARIK